MDIQKSELGRLVNKYFCHCTAAVSTFDSTVFIHNPLGPVFVPLGFSVMSSIFPLFFFPLKYSVVRFFLSLVLTLVLIQSAFCFRTPKDFVSVFGTVERCFD